MALSYPIVVGRRVSTRSRTCSVARHRTHRVLWVRCTGKIPVVVPLPRIAPTGGRCRDLAACGSLCPRHHWRPWLVCLHVRPSDVLPWSPPLHRPRCRQPCGTCRVCTCMCVHVCACVCGRLYRGGLRSGGANVTCLDVASRLPGASTGAKPGGLSMSLTSRGLRMRGTSRARVGGAMGALGLNNSTAGGSAGGGPSLLGFIAEPSSAVPKIAEEETPPSADVADASGEGTPNEAEEAPPSTTARIVGRARCVTVGAWQAYKARLTHACGGAEVRPRATKDQTCAGPAVLSRVPCSPPLQSHQRTLLPAPPRGIPMAARVAARLACMTVCPAFRLSRVHTGPTPADLLSKSYENRLSRSYEVGVVRCMWPLGWVSP